MIKFGRFWDGKRPADASEYFYGYRVAPRTPDPSIEYWTRSNRGKTDLGFDHFEEMVLGLPVETSPDAKKDEPQIQRLYAIGIERSPHNVGMVWGPSRSLDEALAWPGERDMTIFELDGDPLVKGDPKITPIYYWNTLQPIPGWVKIPKRK
jgi:hypothetical protein